MKPVLVFYVNIGNLDPSDVQVYMSQFSDSLRGKEIEKDYYTLSIPVRNQATRVECLNPSIINDKKASLKFKSSLNLLRRNTQDLVDSFPYISRNKILIEKI